MRSRKGSFGTIPNPCSIGTYAQRRGKVPSVQANFPSAKVQAAYSFDSGCASGEQHRYAVDDGISAAATHADQALRCDFEALTADRTDKQPQSRIYRPVSRRS